VYWACDHTRIQTTQRLYDSFTQSHIKQVEIKPEESLAFADTGLILFEQNDHSEPSIRINIDQFEALLSFGKNAPARLAAFSVLSSGVLPSEENDSYQPVLVMTLGTASTSPNQPNLINISQLSWLEVVQSGHEIRIVSK
jgi:hypothetical protein